MNNELMKTIIDLTDEKLESNAVKTILDNIGSDGVESMPKNIVNNIKGYKIFISYMETEGMSYQDYLNKLEEHKLINSSNKEYMMQNYKNKIAEYKSYGFNDTVAKVIFKIYEMDQDTKFLKSYKGDFVKKEIRNLQGEDLDNFRQLYSNKNLYDKYVLDITLLPVEEFNERNLQNEANIDCMIDSNAIDNSLISNSDSNIISNNNSNDQILLFDPNDSNNNIFNENFNENNEVSLISSNEQKELDEAIKESLKSAKEEDLQRKKYEEDLCKAIKESEILENIEKSYPDLKKYFMTKGKLSEEVAEFCIDFYDDIHSADKKYKDINADKKELLNKITKKKEFKDELQNLKESECYSILPQSLRDIIDNLINKNNEIITSNLLTFSFGKKKTKTVGDNVVTNDDMIPKKTNYDKDDDKFPFSMMIKSSNVNNSEIHENVNDFDKSSSISINDNNSIIDNDDINTNNNLLHYSADYYNLMNNNSGTQLDSLNNSAILLCNNDNKYDKLLKSYKDINSNFDDKLNNIKESRILYE